VLVIVFGIWWWFSSQSAGVNSVIAPTAQPNNGGTQAAVPAESQTIVSTDTSDASLNQDLTNIDSQLNGLASDSASVDASLNQSTTVQ
jgi:hypothetical protein